MIPGGWWRRRTPRERWSLLAGSAFLSGLLLFLALEPVVEENRRLAAELPRLRAHLAWMTPRVAEVKRLRAAARPVPAAAERPLSPGEVETLLQDAGIREQVSALHSLEEGGLSLALDEVAFSNLVAFISQLQHTSQGRVAELHVERLAASPGAVSATLRLRHDVPPKE